MKGPGLRTDLDVRRLWRCPRCGRELRYSGDVVSRLCHCQKEGTFMQLVEENPSPAPKTECREVRGAGGIPESFAPPSEDEFGAGIPPANAASSQPAPGPEAGAPSDDQQPE